MLYCSAPVPPLAFTVSVPSLFPHDEGVDEVLMAIAAGSVTVAFETAVHPLMSVTTML